MSKARVKVLKVENVSGTSKASGKPYSMEIAHVLDLDTFDKMKFTIPDAEARAMIPAIGKEGVLDFGVDPATKFPYFVGFKAAA